MGMDVAGVAVNKFDWSGLVDKLNDVAPEANITGASANYDDAGMNVTITIGEGESAQNVTVSVPDLESPGGIDSTAYETLLAKLEDTGVLSLTDEEMEAVAKAFGDLSSTPLPESTGSVLFDLYKLMALMLESMQAQRDAARELRTAENQAIQTAIQHQAQAQRDAAIVGIVVGLVVCAIQLGLQGMALHKSVSGNKMQRMALKESGIGPAQKHADVAKNTFETQTKNVQSKQNMVDAAETRVTDATTARDTARTEVDAAQTAVEQKTIARDNARAELAALPENAPPEQVRAAQTKLETAEAELTTATEQHTAAQAKLETAEAELTTATEARETAVQARETAQTELEAAGKEVESTQRTLEQAEHRLQGDKRNLLGRNQQDMWHNIGDMIGAAGAALQTTTRSATEIIQAEATEEGADIKKAENDLDQTKDLFAQAQEVIRSVLSLFSAIIQAESQSMRDTIHA